MTRIENEAQYKWAVNRVEELLPLVTDETPLDNANLIELELLSNLVADYSEAHFALGEPTFMDIVKLRMYELGISTVSLCKHIGISPARLRNYFNGKSEPTLTIARAMCNFLGVDTNLALSLKCA